MITTKELHAILEQYCTQKYHIEYHDYHSNHLAHGVIALYKLGASRDRILEFVKWYVPRLEAPRPSRQQPNIAHTKLQDGDDWHELMGQREEYIYLRNKYTMLLKEKYQNNIQEFIRSELPKMADGLHCAALHPVIHMGYGLEVQSDTTVVEGMAYLHFSYIKTGPLPAQSSDRTLDVLEALQKIKESDIKAETQLYANNPEWMPSITNTFLRKMEAVTKIPAIRNRLMDIVQKIAFPEWFDREKAEMQDILRLMETVLHWALTVYACAEYRNDFFLLHGVTAGWSLFKIFHIFTDPVKAFDISQYYLAALCSVYVAQDCAAVEQRSLQSPPKCSMEDIRTEVLTKTLDEHVYKLVHVCYELSQRNKGEDKQGLYKVACRLAIDEDFIFEP